jgi:hypothetical protein
MPHALMSHTFPDNARMHRAASFRFTGREAGVRKQPSHFVSEPNPCLCRRKDRFMG